VVRFYGNAYTSMERAEELALLRAAELAVSNGYANIALMTGTSYIDVSQYRTGGDYYQTQGYVYLPPSGSGHVNLTTQYVEPTTITYHRPCTMIGVRCFDDRPDDIREDVPILSAAFIQDSLGRKYDVKRLLTSAHGQ